MIGALCSPILMRRFDRKPVLLCALGGTTVFAQLVVNLRLFDLMPDNGDPLLLPSLLANAAGFTFCLGVGSVAIMSMIGDIIDENELVTGLRQEGLFYSARAFFAKASYSFGHFFAGVMLVAYKHEVDKFYKTVDWDLLAFFAALFAVINVMEHALVLDALGSGIAKLLSLPQHVDASVLLVSSAVARSVTDNIPLAAMLAQILGNLKDAADFSPAFWWCVIFGANLGGNITPIGSASTVVAATIIQRQQLKLGFVDFVKVAAPFAAMQIVIAIVYVLIVSVMFP